MDASSSELNYLDAIAKLHTLVNRHLINLRISKEVIDAENQIIDFLSSNKQSINDQAYFLLAWGQLEVQIRRTHDESDRNEETKDSTKKDHSRLSFKKQLSKVFEKDSNEWKRVWLYYTLRNDIAHGNLHAEFATISTMFADFLDIQSTISQMHS